VSRHLILKGGRPYFLSRHQFKIVGFVVFRPSEEETI